MDAAGGIAGVSRRGCVWPVAERTGDEDRALGVSDVDDVRRLHDDFV